MNNLDDLAWKREFDRVEANQEKLKSKQREGWELKNQPKVYVASLRLDWKWPTSHSEQFNKD